MPKPNPVQKGDPSKQGLKRFLGNIIGKRLGVQKGDPSKQGLKHRANCYCIH